MSLLHKFAKLIHLSERSITFVLVIGSLFTLYNVIASATLAAMLLSNVTNWVFANLGLSFAFYVGYIVILRTARESTTKDSEKIGELSTHLLADDIQGRNEHVSSI